MLGIEPRRGHRRFEVEAQPLLDALHAGALGEVEKQHQVEYERRGEDRIAAQEIDLDLHRIAEPAEDIDVVPAFFLVSARRIVIDFHRVKKVLVKFRIQIWLQDLVQYAELRFFLRFKRPWIFQHLPVAIAEDVRGEPAIAAQHARLQTRRDQRLHVRLAGLEVLAADGQITIARQPQQGRNVVRQIRRAIREWHPRHQRRVGVHLAGRDIGIVLGKAMFKGGQRLMHFHRLMKNLSRSTPDHD